MAEEEEKKEDTKEPKAKSGPNILVIIAALLAVQAAVAFAVVMLVIPKEADDLESLKNPESRVPNTNVIADEVILPAKVEVIVNIAGTDGMRFLKGRVALAYDRKNPANKGFENVLLGLEAQLKSKMSEYLSTLTLAQVNDRNIRRIVSTELLSELNTIIPITAGRLSNVYVEEFIIQ